MDSYKNTFNIQQGEIFPLNFELYSNIVKGTPYIVSDEIANPYFVITLGDNVYDKNGFKVSYWCKYLGQTFHWTTPFEISKEELESLNFVNHKIVCNSIDDIKSFLNNSFIEDEYRDDKILRGVYHTTDGTNDIYYYFNYSLEINNMYIEIVDYTPIVIGHQFRTEDTATMSSSEYYYSVVLCGGELMDIHIDKYILANDIQLPDTIITYEDKFNYLQKFYKDAFQQDITEYDNDTLGWIDTMISIIKPTSVKSNNNIRQLI